MAREGARFGREFAMRVEVVPPLASVVIGHVRLEFVRSQLVGPFPGDVEGVEETNVGSVQSFRTVLAGRVEIRVARDACDGADFCAAEAELAP